MGISVSKVLIAVDDQEKAKEFWTNQIGFEVVTDEPYGEERWLKVRPPGQPVALVLSVRSMAESRRSVPDNLPHSDVFFECADLEETYRALTESGVRFPVPPTKMPFGLVVDV